MGIIKGLLEEYDQKYYTEKIDEAKKTFDDFISKFPREKLSEMSLEDYALGKTKTGSFCWWLEYNSRILGSIKGGSAFQWFLLVVAFPWHHPFLA